MSIKSDKQDILNTIGATKTIVGGLPLFKKVNSLSSINNDGDSISFLIDILKTLTGIDDLFGKISEFLATNLEELEIDIKEALKDELKSVINCNVNPDIPDFLKHPTHSTGTALDIPLNKVDLLDIFYINPTSLTGPLLYNDNLNGVNSTDLNVVLFETVQANGSEINWKGSNDNDVLSMTFNETTSSGNNRLTLSASEYYSNPANNKKLLDLNNDFIDSLELFDTSSLINKIVDVLYGSISFNNKKNTSQLKSEEEINQVLDNLINSVFDEIDDSFFTFDQAEVGVIEENSINRKNGIRKLVNCGNVESSINLDTLLNGTDAINSATTQEQVITATNDMLNNIANDGSESASESDKNTAKLSFIEELIKALSKTIMNVVISPKLMVLFRLNHAIIYGPTAEWTNGLDFIRKNKKLVKAIVNRVRDIIVNFLLSLVLRLITTLVARQISGDLLEKTNLAKGQLLSLVGVPQDIIRLISGLR